MRRWTGLRFASHWKEGQILCVGLDGTGVAGAPLPVRGRGQMRYDEYRWLGLPIGSGRVDVACL